MEEYQNFHAHMFSELIFEFIILFKIRLNLLILNIPGIRSVDNAGSHGLYRVLGISALVLDECDISI